MGASFASFAPFTCRLVTQVDGCVFSDGFQTGCES